MPYDDIRFSHWDDPDDDECDEHGGSDDMLHDGATHDNLEECRMCGIERKLNSQGYCSKCWTVWNS